MGCVLEITCWLRLTESGWCSWCLVYGQVTDTKQGWNLYGLCSRDNLLAKTHWEWLVFLVSCLWPSHRYQAGLESVWPPDLYPLTLIYVISKSNKSLNRCRLYVFALSCRPIWRGVRKLLTWKDGRSVHSFEFWDPLYIWMPLPPSTSQSRISWTSPLVAYTMKLLKPVRHFCGSNPLDVWFFNQFLATQNRGFS
jgi:hypothetical protein